MQRHYIAFDATPDEVERFAAIIGGESVEPERVPTDRTPRLLRIFRDALHDAHVLFIVRRETNRRG